jgi:hypothetical protein
MDRSSQTPGDQTEKDEGIDPIVGTRGETGFEVNLA